MYKTILGIETSCDETAAAVLEQRDGRIHILSNVVASSADLQVKFGGVIPEQAAREQLKSIIPVIQESLQVSGYREQDLDAIAVTYGPGLIGSLLVGVETAKTLAYIWNKPLIPVNHLIGHFYANWIGNSSPKFPCVGLLVSGGHTDLVLFTSHGKYEYLGGTRDDAAGECFDKCARLLGYPYPGGPQIAKLAQKGNPKAFNFPRPMLDSKDLGFSFSGLKTAFANVFKENPKAKVEDLAASLEAAIIDSLVIKTVKATQEYKVEQIIVAGGVAANQKLINDLRLKINDLGLKLSAPPVDLCTDNGAMIAAAAFFSPRSLRVASFAGEAGQKPIKNPFTLQANPGLSLEL